MFSHIVARGYTTDGGAQTSPSVTYSGDTAEGLSVSLAPSTTDQKLALPITVSDIVALYFYSSLAITLKTYWQGVLQETFTIPAAKAQLWTNDGIISCPFTKDFDHIKLTNADGAQTAVVSARFLMIGLGS